jgi:hypothetical protein
MVIGGQVCPQFFGGFVLAGRVGFSLKIFEIKKVIENKLVSHIY